VLLLVVIALLAIFALIGVAFVVVTSQAQRSAKSGARIEQGSTDPSQPLPARLLLQQAIMQVLHGPTTDASGNPNAASVLGAHSLLEDMYGNGWVSGTISGTTTVGTGFQQLFNISQNPVPAAEVARRGGCVLTITNQYRNSDPTQPNPCYGLSTRIVGITPGGTDLQLMAFPQLDSNNQPLHPAANDTFVINGVPFSGTGFGFDATGGSLSCTVGSGTSSVTGALALFPSHASNRNPLGGANSDYTAADFQHIFLAAQGTTTTAGGGVQVRTLPSMHRPALCRYWAEVSVIQSGGSPLDFTVGGTAGVATLATAAGSTSMSSDLKRAIIMRPLPEDHPDFTGSNPTYTGAGGTASYQSGFNPCWDGVTTFGQTPPPFSWDVDNDGDGVPDSVWIDLGLPVRATADGRLYKPLFAILCVDLDGRLNLNAHGSLAQTDTANYNGTPISKAGGTITGSPGFSNLGHGQGLGPAEISLSPILTNYLQLFTGNTANGIQGRYGTGSASVLCSSSINPVYLNNWFEYGQTSGYGQNYWDFSNVNNAGSYGSPPDPFGAGAVGLDQAGRPVYVGVNAKVSGVATAYVGFGSGLQYSPYQLNLGANAGRGLANNFTGPDNPFSPAELERLLRPYDVDALGLPGRLSTLTGLAAIDGRLKVTTDSWDAPVPITIGGSAADVASRWLQKHGVAGTATLTMLPTLLPPELFVGLKMNINRPFGNGQDDSGNVNNPVVDGPSETDNDQTKNGNFVLSGVTGGSSTFGFSFSGTASAAGSMSSDARRLEAQYLYVLMCMTCDLNYLNTQLGGSTATASYIAQWAVNAVDFKARDSIMTPFDYDPTFADAAGTITGWNATARVWGCKRPELLLSETLAFHDRRTQDSDQEVIDQTEGDDQDTKGQTTDPPTTTPPHKHDASFDQTYRPQGSLFVELYSPSSPLEPRSGDLYAYDAAAGRWKLDLTRVSGTASGSPLGSPVWRLRVASGSLTGGGSSEPLDPDDPDPTKWPTIEREVYFVSSSSATLPPTLANSQAQFYPSTTSNSTSILISPGGYAVIGPGEKDSTYQNGNPKRTYIGFLSGGTGGSDTTRYIDLGSMGTTLVNNNTNSRAGGTVTDPESTVTDKINRPAVLAIDSPHRLSVSEPIGGAGTKDYDAMEADQSNISGQGALAGGTGSAAGVDTNGKYAQIYDIPFDQKRTDDKTAVQTDGTTPKYRMIYLQRLANPLLPYDASTNPYRTVDAMAVDLTSFNGLPKLSAAPSEPGIASGTATFESRQRGENNDTIASYLNSNLNLWKQEPVDKGASIWDATVRTQADHCFQNGLKHSFGYLNQPFGVPVDGSTGGYKGDPSQPFPWLAWNNRPYVNPLELLLVPACRSSKLLTNASSGTQAADPSSSEYCQYFNFIHGGNSATVAQYSTGTLTGPTVAYPHLLNFFQSAVGTATGNSPQFHRVLGYLGVPSPFVGADTWANPTAAGTSTGHAYHPPFDRISNYREPGKINLNTIYSQDVFNGLMAGGSSTTWTDFVTSRRGGASANILDTPDPSVPTEFAHPFRSFGGAFMVPKLTSDPLQPINNREINATLLREGATAGQPLFGGTSTNAYNNTDRNPYFRYQGVQRLANLVTTRSNVFAVWITVGYFEVEPVATAHPTWTAAQIQAAIQSTFPDGYCLGRELGIDTGEVERHRAFYIIDRTLPVGFKRGEDLNSDKAILVNRFIE
jgi:hypothetical protein